MSRPYREVVLFDNIQSTIGTDGALQVNNNTQYVLKASQLYKLWTGSIEKFIKDFELPEDSLIETKKANLSSGATAVINWDLTTINFKFNYQVWYKDPTNDNYIFGSNNTVNLTCPNVLTFNGNNPGDSEPIYFAGGTRVYNPNIYPLPISISSFIVSNKVNDFQAVVGQGTNSLCYLVFRFGVNGNDIEICLQTRDSSAFQVNNSQLVMPYATLTFTGFNRIKRLR